MDNTHFWFLFFVFFVFILQPILDIFGNRWDNKRLEKEKKANIKQHENNVKKLIQAIEHTEKECGKDFSFSDLVNISKKNGLLNEKLLIKCAETGLINNFRRKG